jgi:hypothetical protein
MAALLSGCAAGNRLEAAAGKKAEASVVTQALQVDLPSQPPECGQPERSGVRQGDRLDVALVKTDRALGRANEKSALCARWYDELRIGIAASRPRPQ